MKWLFAVFVLLTLGTAYATPTWMELSTDIKDFRHHYFDMSSLRSHMDGRKHYIVSYHTKSTNIDGGHETYIEKIDCTAKTVTVEQFTIYDEKGELIFKDIEIIPDVPIAEFTVTDIKRKHFCPHHEK